MKWIGQLIYDKISRFRSDVYLEGLSTTTGTDALVEDSDGKISKNTSIGGDITSLGTLTSLTVTNASDTGNCVAITNNDVDIPAIVVTAQNTTKEAILMETANTTANGVSLTYSALTTGSAMYIDVNDTLTASATKSLLAIDYDKSGVTASGQTSWTKGLDISMVDAATNNASGTVNLEGIIVTLDSASDQGTIYQAGLTMQVTDGDTNTGIDLQIENGGIDFIARSSADSGDYFKIETTTNGATTLTTLDDDAGAAAHFEIAANGDITLDSAGQIKLEPTDGSNILLDGTVTVDGGAVGGLASLTSSDDLDIVATGNDINIDTDHINVTSSTSSKPILKMTSTNTAKDQSAELRFVKDADTADTEDGEDCGQITWYGAVSYTHLTLPTIYSV